MRYLTLPHIMKNWGFCMAEKQKQMIFKNIKLDKFHVFIDSLKKTEKCIMVN